MSDFVHDFTKALPKVHKVLLSDVALVVELSAQNVAQVVDGERPFWLLGVLASGAQVVHLQNVGELDPGDLVDGKGLFGEQQAFGVVPLGFVGDDDEGVGGFAFKVEGAAGTVDAHILDFGGEVETHHFQAGALVEFDVSEGDAQLRVEGLVLGDDFDLGQKADRLGLVLFVDDDGLHFAAGLHTQIGGMEQHHVDGVLGVRRRGRALLERLGKRLPHDDHGDEMLDALLRCWRREMLHLQLIQLCLFHHAVEAALQTHQRVDVGRLQQVVLMDLLDLLGRPLNGTADLVVLDEKALGRRFRIGNGRLLLLGGHLPNLLVDLI